jgi:short-subunit dehydrogenase
VRVRSAAPAPAPRIVLVTGASSGIGRACAVRLARSGDTVIGVARHAPALDELAAEAAGVETEVCDLRDAGQRSSLVERVLARHGRIDVLVNNAGVGAIGMLHELTGSDIERVYETNTVAVADLTRLVLPSMLARRAGAIVMLSSIGAWVSGPPSTVYASSKFALDGLIEGLRRETRGTGVLVHSVNPAPIATPYLSRVAERSPQPGDPQVPDAPGFPVSWVADAVVDVAGSRRPRTRSVPRAAGLLRWAQVPVVGAVLDVTVSRLARPAVSAVQRLVDERTRGLPRR